MEAHVKKTKNRVCKLHNALMNMYYLHVTFNVAQSILKKSNKSRDTP